MAGTGAERTRRARTAPEERRRQIIEATLACLAREEPQRWTLRQVARDLDVAPSLITYFFESWDGLLLAAYRALAGRAREEIAAAAAGAEDPLQAVANAFFLEDWLVDEVAGAYIAFWSLARGDNGLTAEMQHTAGAHQAALRDLIAARARSAGLAVDPDLAARRLYFLLSGLWYEMAVSPGVISPAEARATAHAEIEAIFSGQG